jgi:glucose-6-phosphate 1-epimerase
MQTILSIETIDFNGLEALRLNGPGGCTAVISKLGGQVLSWLTPDGRERLFLSDWAAFDGSAPIRGGIPVCFPQFSDLGDLPRHGFLRTREWMVESQRCGDDFVLVSLAIADDEETRDLWPFSFRAEITLVLEVDRIDVELCVQNTGGESFEFTAALHSYLRLVQVEDAALEGLYGCNYRDATNQDEIVRETGTELRIEAETDRIYYGVKRPQMLRAGNHSLTLQNQGFPDVVVWNPWVERCAQLADMPPDDWRQMLCIEAAAVEKPVSLAPGEDWVGRQALVVA